MDFVKFPRTHSGHYSSFVIVDHFTRMFHFIFCSKTDNVAYITSIFFRELVKIYGVPLTIVSDGDVKFLSYFSRTF